MRGLGVPAQEQGPEGDRVIVLFAQSATQRPDSKKPVLKGRAKCLILLVPTAGFELAT